MTCTGGRELPESSLPLRSISTSPRAITSPPDLEPRARQVARLIELLMKRTDPSANAVFTPPEW